MPTSITQGRPQAVRSRNIALFSIVAVIGSGWLAFRSQSPRQGDQFAGRRGERAVVSEQDIQTMSGGKPGEASPGRAPSHQK
ncbi:uncharacterized protein LDX57_009091 [Aspergillus melleus]|uniref:uncharacterized protein n=1 Tax=Aspergillus melleus TaxID=138277 RepID=UPI001E8DDF09|nr:uncharacterized protein LDX57_009091 [Aspergillus melleus]KAH8431430.1 hypothetical protein LDX57_009091 [Aspergillus melleus]